MNKAVPGIAPSGPALDVDVPVDSLVEALVENYAGDPRGHHINRRFLPSREEIFTCLQQLVELMYPGYFDRQDLTDENIRYHVGNLLVTVRETLVLFTLFYPGGRSVDEVLAPPLALPPLPHPPKFPTLSMNCSKMPKNSNAVTN